MRSCCSSKNCHGKFTNRELEHFKMWFEKAYNRDNYLRIPAFLPIEWTRGKYQESGKIEFNFTFPRKWDVFFSDQIFKVFMYLLYWIILYLNQLSNGGKPNWHFKIEFMLTFGLWRSGNTFWKQAQTNVAIKNLSL